jgi:NDP-sugar pyrophosphorylase family protein
MINRITSQREDFYAVWEQLISQRQAYCSSIYPKRWFAVDTFEQLSSINEIAMSSNKMIMSSASYLD